MDLTTYFDHGLFLAYRIDKLGVVPKTQILAEIWSLAIFGLSKGVKMGKEPQN